MFFKKRKFIKISRVSRKSVNLTNVNINFKDNNLIISNSVKNIYFKLNKSIFIKKIKNCIYICPVYKSKFSNSLSGTIRSILINIINGFDIPYEKKLLLVGVGYKALLQYNYLYLYLGFTHPILCKIPYDVKLIISSLVEITILGSDKQKIYQLSSLIRNIKKPDSYKGRGIRYFNEKVTLKIIKKK